jgi:hypothetical protein
MPVFGEGIVAGETNLLVRVIIDTGKAHEIKSLALIIA